VTPLTAILFVSYRSGTSDTTEYPLLTPQELFLGSKKELVEVLKKVDRHFCASNPARTADCAAQDCLQPESCAKGNAAQSVKQRIISQAVG